MKRTGKDGRSLPPSWGTKYRLVGDDLFVTNTERLAKGISLGCGNSILIKLNQIGSVSETLEAIKMHTKPDTQPFLLTVPERQKIPQSQIWLSH